jgi:hypothetical protein
MFQNQDTDLHQHRTLLMHWDGTSWSLVPSPSPGKSAELGGIAFSSSGEAYGVGIYSEYPIDIYDGHYTLAQALTLGAGSTGNVGVGPGSGATVASLGAPAPNPTTGQASFTLRLPNRGDVALSVFDVRGRKLGSILNTHLEAGERSVTWNGVDERGVRCRPGLYFVRMTVDGRIVTTRSVALLGAVDRE